MDEDITRAELRGSKKPFYKKKPFIIITSILLVLILALAGLLGYYYKASDNALSNIKREKLLPTSSKEVKPPDPSSGKPLTYLLLGSDSRNMADKGRSDTMMMAYIPANRKNIYLISFPRDLYVDIPGIEKQKINAAYQNGGAPLAVQTVENLTQTNIQHVALVDFNSFVGLVDSLGGVTINNPYQGYDNSQGLSWNKGKIKLSSYSALHYVRWRHGLPNGDITRDQNQQRVIKAIISKMLSAGVITNPMKITDILNKTSKYVTVDDTMTNNNIRSTLLNMNISSANDIKTITAPIAGYDNNAKYGSIDLVDDAKMQELQKALATDTMDIYYNKHKSDPVAGKDTAADNANNN